MSVQNPVFIPGPTNMPEAIRNACNMPTIDHRSPAFGAILHPCLDNVRAILKSRQAQVFIFPSTGTGGWETAITNTLSPGDKVLVARNGMFSHRWIDMCQRHGLDVTIIETPWGAGLPADRYGEILAADKGQAIKAVLATHNETATGVRSDIGALRQAIDEAGHPALLLVDGVSSIASMDFRFDEWGVDIAVTGSQKGFMLPPGLAILGFSERAMAAVSSAELPRTFFDVRDMAKGYAANGFPYTPPVGPPPSHRRRRARGRPRLGAGAVRADAGHPVRHGQRHPHAARFQRHRHRHPGGHCLWRRPRHRPRRGRGKGLPDRPSG